MHDVFISYSTKDIQRAEAIRNVLEDNGISCWMAPRDIPAGSNYSREIPVAIRTCQVFLLILSNYAQESPWVLKELDSAVNCAKVIIPFMLEDFSLNDEFNFLLTGAQRYSAYQKKAEVIETLIARIRAITGAPEKETHVEDIALPKPEKAEKAVSGGNCPACSGGNLEELQKKIGKYTWKEKLWSLALPVGLVAGVIAGLIVGMILLSVIDFNYSATGTVISICMLLGMVAGGWFGWKMPREYIRRMRIRNGFYPYPFRCKDCKKEFLMKK